MSTQQVYLLCTPGCTFSIRLGTRLISIRRVSIRRFTFGYYTVHLNVYTCTNMQLTILLPVLQRYADQKSMKYLETSALMNINVQQVLQEIASEMCNREEQVNRGAEPPIRLARDSGTVKTQDRSRKKCSC